MRSTVLHITRLAEETPSSGASRTVPDHRPVDPPREPAPKVSSRHSSFELQTGAARSLINLLETSLWTGTCLRLDKDEPIAMDTLQPRADWETVGDKWFRKTQTYTAVFDPDLDLDNYILVGAPFAGAIGMFASRVCSFLP